MKTDVPKTEATEELMPFFRSIFWQHNEMGSALFLREPVKRHKVSVIESNAPMAVSSEVSLFPIWPRLTK
jgi:hypothetical protein